MDSKLNLSVEINQKSGFCFGVVKAIEKAEQALKNGNEIFSIGQIVHNDEEVKRLETLGLKTISQTEMVNIKNKTVLFRAHGEPKSSYEIAHENKNTIIDASCPIILKLQSKVVASYKNNETILIYGKPDHPETIGLASCTENNAIVFKDIQHLDFDNLPKDLTLYSQTTMSLEAFNNVVEVLQKKGFNVKINDTICRQVSNRKNELKDFAIRFHKIVFIAGKNSSNGKVLYDICKSSNPNSIFISSLDDLQKDWFLPNETIGISGATSTPLWQMESLKKTLEQW